MPNKDVTFKIYPINEPNKSAKELFPELQQEYVTVDHNTIGVACSGGGSRSLALWSGYFRGLRELELLDRIKYLSCVSGGSWFGSIFTYASEEDDDIALLGKSVDPHTTRLDKKFLKNNNPGKIATVVSKFFGVWTAISQRLQGIPLNKAWQRMIGKSLLKEFNLNKKCFCYDQNHKDAMLEINKENSSILKKLETAVLPRDGRPFLILNAVLGGPLGYSSGWGHSLQFTPLYSGTPFYTANNYSYHISLSRWNNLKRSFWGKFFKPKPVPSLNELYELQISGKDDRAINLISGGGVVDTYAFGAYSIEKSLLIGANKVEAKIYEPCYLEDAIGASSAAFAAYFQNKAISFKLEPSKHYTPSLKTGSELFDLNNFKGQKRRTIGDGGNYENTGILPLIQRGLKKIVCFVNSAMPLKQRPPLMRVSTLKNEELLELIDSQFLSLFGAVEEIKLDFNYTRNQIFEKSKLDEVLTDLWKARENRKGGVIRKQLKLVKNSYWNINREDIVDILFVYNERCLEFHDLLPTETVEKFTNYPNFKTTFQGKRPFSLSISDVNLAAAHAEYVIKANQEIFIDFFRTLPAEPEENNVINN